MDIFELKLQVTFDDVMFLLGCLGVFESKETMAIYVKAPMRPDPDHVGYCKGLQQKLYDALRRSCKGGLTQPNVDYWLGLTRCAASIN